MLYRNERPFPAMAYNKPALGVSALVQIIEGLCFLAFMVLAVFAWSICP